MFEVEDVFSAEPLLVAIVVHLIAEPRRGVNLRAFLRSFLLFVDLFMHSRGQDDGGVADKRRRGNVALVGEILAEMRVRVGAPHDILTGRLVFQKDGQHVLDRVLGNVDECLQMFLSLSSDASSRGASPLNAQRPPPQSTNPD